MNRDMWKLTPGGTRFLLAFALACVGFLVGYALGLHLGLDIAMDAVRKAFEDLTMPVPPVPQFNPQEFNSQLRS